MKVCQESEYDFTEDEKAGRWTEDKIFGILTFIIGFTCEFAPHRNDKGRDIRVLSPVRFDIEIKGDHVAATNSNIAIEYHCRGKYSGIAVTTSDYWIQVIAKRFFKFKEDNIQIMVFNTEKLKKCIEILHAQPLPLTKSGWPESWSGGDDNEFKTKGWTKTENIGDPGSNTCIWVTKRKWAVDYAEFLGTPREFVDWAKAKWFMKPVQFNLVSDQ